jgi:hypothetical protein
MKKIGRIQGLVFTIEHTGLRLQHINYTDAVKKEQIKNILSEDQ